MGVEKLTAFAKTIATYATAWVVIISILGFIFRAELEIAREVAKAPEQIAALTQKIDELTRPKLIDHLGVGFVLKSSLQAGQNQTFTFFLKRNATCETDIEEVFYNLETGVTYRGRTVRSTQVPISKDFIPFSLAIEVPSNLPSGIYTYVPRIVPIDCGVYQPYVFTPSSSFTVVGLNDG